MKTKSWPARHIIKTVFSLFKSIHVKDKYSRDIKDTLKHWLRAQPRHGTRLFKQNIEELTVKGA